MLVMILLETRIYINEFRWYIRFVVIYVMVGEAAMFNLVLSVRQYYSSRYTTSVTFIVLMGALLVVTQLFVMLALLILANFDIFFSYAVQSFTYTAVRLHARSASSFLVSYNYILLVLITLILNLYFLQFLFGILMVVYLPSVDPYPGYTPIRNEVLVDNTDYEPLPGGEQICPERHVNIFASK